jgi:hypothetical protein
MIIDADGTRTRMPVAVQKAPHNSKLYLGGYRHKKTGFLYHHASTNTVSKIERKDFWVNGENRSHRETQTYILKTRSMMTGREFGTQMERKDLLLDDSNDREIISKPYFSATQLNELKSRTILIIQCYWRGYVARKKTWLIREAHYNAYVNFRENQEKSKKELEEIKKQDIERRIHPKTVKDFELLYSELESWVKLQMKELNESFKKNEITEMEKRSYINEILSKQTKALQTIDKLKNEANQFGLDKRINKMLEVMAKPKLWELSNGEVQEVHTQFTIRAAELMDLYQGLIDPSMDIDERLDILLNVKWTVREFDCGLSRDIVDLCDREAETLNRGRSVETLKGLRKRLSNLFLQFIESPDFNPEAVRFLKVPPKNNNQNNLNSNTMVVGGGTQASTKKLMSLTA